MEKNNPHILIFSLAYFPDLVGGAEVAVKELTDRMSDLQFSMVTIRGPHEKKVERVGNIQVYRVGPHCGTGFLGKLLFQCSKYAYPFLAYRKAQSLHVHNQFDTIWSIMANHAGFTARLFKKKNPNVRFVLTLQEGDPIPYIKKKVRLVYSAFQDIFARADSVTAISHYLMQFARDMGYTKEGIVIGNGVDIAHFSKELSPERRKEIRTRLGFSDDHTVLVTASRLVVKNGVVDVIDALVQLPEKYVFLVIGVGGLEASLRARAEDIHVAHRVHFLGYISHHDLPQYLHASDIFIRPSLSEGLGNAFLEAMVAGIPVIATPVGGIPDFLKEKETGVFCEVNNPESICRAVSILEDDTLRSHVITQAKHMVADRYDWDALARRMQEVLSETTLSDRVNI